MSTGNGLTRDELGAICARIQTDYEPLFRSQGVDVVIGYHKDDFLAELVWDTRRRTTGMVVHHPIRLAAHSNDLVHATETSLRTRLDRILLDRPWDKA
jgi:hypothetical protein